jgi:hypothetical protein
MISYGVIAHGGTGSPPQFADDVRQPAKEA